MATVIITDSTSDIPEDLRQELNIEVVSLSIQIDGVSYTDRTGLTHEQFYDKLETADKLPKTSQPPPQTFVDIFKKHLDAGNDIVGIFISEKMSGTYNSACMAKEILETEDVFIVDSKSVSLGLSVLVSEAAKYREMGHDAKTIACHIKELTKKISFFTVISTLKYVRKGGRISATSAVIGELLGMKPIIAMIDGAAQVIGKARGMTAAINLMLKKIEENMPNLNYITAFAHACSPELLEKAIACLKMPLQLKDYIICSVGSVVGTYSGRNAVAFAYISN